MNWKVSIDLAVKHKIPGLICFSGNRQPHMSEIEAIEAVPMDCVGLHPMPKRKGSISTSNCSTYNTIIPATARSHGLGRGSL
ncbi:MAG: hypothetical protein U0175_32710 [Caldilineaceae bacterium]